jgi:hypothetical protein
MLSGHGWIEFNSKKNHGTQQRTQKHRFLLSSIMVVEIKRAYFIVQTFIGVMIVETIKNRKFKFPSLWLSANEN